jgi:hypothetical protein
MKSKLEIEMEALRTRLNEVAEQVRLNAVAEAWLAGNHDIRQGDYFLLNKETPTQLYSVQKWRDEHGNINDGKWTYRDSHGSTIEPHRIPDQADHDRLYTKTEVAAIIALVKGAP